MSLRPIDDQLIKYLTDAHSIEEQAIAQMRAAPDLSGDPGLAAAFRAHLAESERHKQLLKYLSDAHAIENQAIQLLQKGEQIAGDPILAQLYREHLDETREHAKLVDTLLETHGGSTNAIKDAAMRLGALNWGGFFAA